MPVVNDIQEVCPLEGRKLLIFGYTGAGYIIYLISEDAAAVIDSFAVQDPVVSPDQHWLAMRDWIVPQSETFATDQYLLYDLTKDASANRQYPRVTPGTALRYGRTMYPVTRNHVPFANHGVRREQTHVFAGGSFYWSADSRYVVFTDRTYEGLNLVLVKVGEKDLNTLLHPLADGDICGTLSGATVTSPRYGVLEVQATFQAAGTTPCTKTLALHDEDFHPAKEEVFPPRKARPSVQIK